MVNNRFFNLVLAPIIIFSFVISYPCQIRAQETGKQETETQIDQVALKKLVGKWQAVKMTANGNVVPPEPVQAISMTFSAEKLVVTGNTGPDSSMDCKFKLDGSHDPGHFDFLPESQGEWVKGIFKWEEDRLIVCLRKEGGERPTTFESTAENECLLIEMKKPSPNDKTPGSDD